MNHLASSLSLGVSSLALALGALGCADAASPARAPDAASRAKSLTQEEMAARVDEMLARENGPFGKHEVSFLDGAVQGTVEAASKPTVECEDGVCQVVLDMGRDGDGDANSIVCAVAAGVAAFGPLVTALVHDTPKTEMPTLTTRATGQGLAVSFMTDGIGQTDDGVLLTTAKAAALYGRGYTVRCHDVMAGGRKTFARVVGDFFDGLRTSESTSKQGVFAAGFHSRSGAHDNGFRFDFVGNREGAPGFEEMTVSFAIEADEGRWKAYDAVGVVMRDAAGNVEDMRRSVWIHGAGPIQISAKPAEDRKMRVKLESGSSINAIELTPPAKANTDVWSAPELLAVSSGRAPSYTFSMPGIADRDPTLQRVTVKRAAPGVLQLQVSGAKQASGEAAGAEDLEVHVDDRGLVKKVVGTATVSERLFTWGELPSGRGRRAVGAASRGAK